MAEIHTKDPFAFSKEELDWLAKDKKARKKSKNKQKSKSKKTT